MRAILLLLLMAGCASTPPPTYTPIRTTVTARSAATVAPVPPLHLFWDYEQPMPVDGIAFDVEQCNDLQSPQWALYYTTNQPPVPFWPTNGQAFYRVGAHYE